MEINLDSCSTIIARYIDQSKTIACNMLLRKATRPWQQCMRSLAPSPADNVFPAVRILLIILCHCCIFQCYLLVFAVAFLSTHDWRIRSAALFEQLKVWPAAPPKSELWALKLPYRSSKTIADEVAFLPSLLHEGEGGQGLSQNLSAASPPPSEPGNVRGDA